MLIHARYMHCVDLQRCQLGLTVFSSCAADALRQIMVLVLRAQPACWPCAWFPADSWPLLAPGVSTPTLPLPVPTQSLGRGRGGQAARADVPVAVRAADAQHRQRAFHARPGTHAARRRGAWGRLRRPGQRDTRCRVGASVLPVGRTAFRGPPSPRACSSEFSSNQTSVWARSPSLAGHAPLAGYARRRGIVAQIPRVAAPRPALFPQLCFSVHRPGFFPWAFSASLAGHAPQRGG